MNANKRKYSVLLSSAKSRGLEVNISTVEYDLLLGLGCNYCGTDIRANQGVGLDRVDSSVGYVSHNVVPCCKRCNVAKNDMDMSEFLDWITRVHSHTQKQINELKTLDLLEIKKDMNRFLNSKQVRNSRKLINRIY